MRGSPPPVSSFQVMPPSSDLYIEVPVGPCERWPPAGPPPPPSPPGGATGPPGPAAEWRPVFASTTTGRSSGTASFWIPVESSTKSVRVHLVPPSVERKTPRSSLLWRGGGGGEGGGGVRR